ncbi:MAG: hypothetical protein ABFS32_00230 [Bacteroidota bacterium]
MNRSVFAGALYLLPVFFFTLAYSPNITGWRIGVILILIYFMFIPAVIQLGNKLSDKGQLFKNWFDYLAVIAIANVLIGGGVIVNWFFPLVMLSLSVAIILFLNPGMENPFGMKRLMLQFLIGIILYAANYIGLNQFLPENLFNSQIIFPLLMSGVLVLFPLTSMSIYNIAIENTCLIKNEDWVKYKVKLLHWLIRLLLFAFVIFFMIFEESRYSGYFVMAIIPGYLMLYLVLRKLMLKRAVELGSSVARINLVNTTVLIIFFLYFFLDKTQVLQAVSAGY